MINNELYKVLVDLEFDNFFLMVLCNYSDKEGVKFKEEVFIIFFLILLDIYFCDIFFFKIFFFYKMGLNFVVWRNIYCYNKSEEEESKLDLNFCVGERCVVIFKLENKIKVLYSLMVVIIFINKI